MHSPWPVPGAQINMLAVKMYHVLQRTHHLGATAITNSVTRPSRSCMAVPRCQLAGGGGDLAAVPTHSPHCTGSTTKHVLATRGSAAHYMLAHCVGHKAGDTNDIRQHHPLHGW